MGYSVGIQFFSIYPWFPGSETLFEILLLCTNVSCNSSLFGGLPPNSQGYESGADLGLLRHLDRIRHVGICNIPMWWTQQSTHFGGFGLMTQMTKLVKWVFVYYRIKIGMMTTLTKLTQNLLDRNGQHVMYVVHWNCWIKKSTAIKNFLFLRLQITTNKFVNTQHCSYTT